jgi:thioredoxin 1
MRRFLLIAATCVALGALAASGPYDEAADAKAQIKSALTDASQANVSVLVVFGANWCGDCKMLDLAFKEGVAAPLIAKNFRVVKVNVGKFDRNTDVAESCGVPLKSGIPAVAILASNGQVLYATKAGELADARSMGDKAIYEFFAKAAASAPR